jgi:hypothetical protein
MLSFHVALHARRPEVAEGPEVQLRGRNFHTLSATSADLATPLPVSFEQASEALGKLERLYFEPDGSLVWVSSQGEPAWQVDGNLFDRDGRLMFVDLKGTCPGEPFDRLISAFGWPATAIMFQLLREAVFLDEAEFRRFAEMEKSPTTPV